MITIRWWVLGLAIPLLIGTGLAVGYLLEATVNAVSSRSAGPAGAPAVDVGSPHVPAEAESARDPAMVAGASFMARVTAYKLRLEKNPNDLEALIFLGNANYDITRFEQSSDYYRKALELDPTNIHVRTDLATSYFNLGRKEEALSEIRKVLEFSPSHETALYNLGVVLLEVRNDTQGAISAWERLLAEHPDSPRAQSIREQVAQLKQQG